MNHTKIILALALLVLFLYTASAAPIDSNTTDSNAIPAGNGYIYITSNPSGADVYIVDLDVNKDYYFYYGKTPVGTLLAARTFKIIVEMAGYKKYTTELIISEYGSTLLRVELQKSDANAASYGNIKVTSRPSKADVYIDERYAGIAPITVEGISAGTHVVTVKLTGYNDYSKEVGVSANKTTSLNAKLTKIKSSSGSVKVTSSPSKADVYFAGQYVGKTPITIKSVAVGEYTLEVKLKGYNSYKTTVKVSANRTTPVHAKLTKSSTKKSAKTTGTAVLPIDEPETGTIKITSNPSNANIYIMEGDYVATPQVFTDSVTGNLRNYIGTTPLTTEFDIGTYTILLKLGGYKDYLAIIKVYANKITSKYAKLKKAPTTTSGVKCSAKSIIGDPNGDGEITAGDSLLIANIVLGIEPKPSNICCVDVDNDKDIDNTDSLKAFKYGLGFTEVESVGNAGKKCSEIATVKQGKLKVTSSPSKADIYVGGNNTGLKTPATNWKADAGTYELTVKKEGYQDFTKKIKISANKTTSVHAKLKKAAVKCTDSDGGKDYYVKGYATIDGGNTKYEDSCAWEASGGDALVETYTLSETYCDSKGSIITESYKCPDGCENGACIKEPTVCGNGIIDIGEECDGNNIGARCVDFGYTEGTITCSSTCKFTITCT